MTVTYTTYMPDRGFEAKQSTIYSNSVEKYDGQPVTEDSIKKRMQRELKSKIKPDFEGLRFAIGENDVPLAYINYLQYSGTEEVYIGYPWYDPNQSEATPEVRDILFTDLLQYIEAKFSDRPIVMGYINANYTEMHEFAKTKGFVEKNRFTRYQFDLETAKAIDAPHYATKIVILDNLDIMVELAKTDLKFMENFNDESSLITYFKDKVLPEGHTIVVLDERGQYIASGAALTGNIKGATLIRATILRPGFEDAFRTMVVALANYCQDNNMDKDPLAIFVSNRTTREVVKYFVQEIKADPASESILHELKNR